MTEQTTGTHRRVVISPAPGRAEVSDEPLAASLETDAVTISDVWMTLGGPAPKDFPPTTPWALLPETDGTTFRIVEFRPGYVPADIRTGMHNTPTIDLGTVLSGEIDLVLEDGSTVTLRAGDQFVLRAAEHTWVNRGDVSCVLSIVLVRSA
jgi:Cupin domain